jgi:phosphopantothenoylcysteine decarboxylase/phosphopantothenate--cysteine ligase
MLDGRQILLVISGGIAAYKCPELIRRLRDRGAMVRCVLSRNAHHFVTPMSLAAVSEEPVYQDLFSLKDETEIGHIRLSREADLVVVAPATADLLAKMATGLADDLASTTLLATDKPVLVAPAMNVMMWQHPATQKNVATLRSRGILQVGPTAGDLACGETGEGRMADPELILEAVEVHFATHGALAGTRALVTSGPTHEPIDPVRYIANRSSGKQGHAIAQALAEAGADTVLISGPVMIPPPPGVTVVPVESADEMLAACRNALPVDVAVCAAAVADWRVAQASNQKIKKSDAGPPTLTLAQNPDILASLSSAGEQRPGLVIGFAAETENLLAHARSKLERKGCDWIVANDVSEGTDTFGGDRNRVTLVTGDGDERWAEMSKLEVARTLVGRIADHLSG